MNYPGKYISGSINNLNTGKHTGIKWVLYENPQPVGEVDLYENTVEAVHTDPMPSYWAYLVEADNSEYYSNNIYMKLPVFSYTYTESMTLNSPDNKPMYFPMSYIYDNNIDISDTGLYVKHKAYDEKDYITHFSDHSYVTKVVKNNTFKNINTTDTVINTKSNDNFNQLSNSVLNVNTDYLRVNCTYNYLKNGQIWQYDIYGSGNGTEITTNTIGTSVANIYLWRSLECVNPKSFTWLGTVRNNMFSRNGSERYNTLVDSKLFNRIKDFGTDYTYTSVVNMLNYNVHYGKPTIEYYNSHKQIFDILDDLTYIYCSPGDDYGVWYKYDMNENSIDEYDSPNYSIQYKDYHKSDLFVLPPSNDNKTDYTDYNTFNYIDNDIIFNNKNVIYTNSEQHFPDTLKGLYNMLTIPSARNNASTISIGVACKIYENQYVADNDTIMLRTPINNMLPNNHYDNGGKIYIPNSSDDEHNFTEYSHMNNVQWTNINVPTHVIGDKLKLNIKMITTNNAFNVSNGMFFEYMGDYVDSHGHLQNWNYDLYGPFCIRHFGLQSMEIDLFYDFDNYHIFYKDNDGNNHILDNGVFPDDERVVIDNNLNHARVPIGKIKIDFYIIAAFIRNYQKSATNTNLIPYTVLNIDGKPSIRYIIKNLYIHNVSKYDSTDNYYNIFDSSINEMQSMFNMDYIMPNETEFIQDLPNVPTKQDIINYFKTKLGNLNTDLSIELTVNHNELENFVKDTIERYVTGSYPEYSKFKSCICDAISMAVTYKSETNNIGLIAGTVSDNVDKEKGWNHNELQKTIHHGNWTDISSGTVTDIYGPWYWLPDNTGGPCKNSRLFNIAVLYRRGNDTYYHCVEDRPGTDNDYYHNYHIPILNNDGSFLYKEIIDERNNINSIGEKFNKRWQDIGWSPTQSQQHPPRLTIMQDTHQLMGIFVTCKDNQGNTVLSEKYNITNTEKNKETFFAELYSNNTNELKPYTYDIYGRVTQSTSDSIIPTSEPKINSNVLYNQYLFKYIPSNTTIADGTSGKFEIRYNKPVTDITFGLNNTWFPWTSDIHIANNVTNTYRIQHTDDNMYTLIINPEKSVTKTNYQQADIYIRKSTSGDYYIDLHFRIRFIKKHSKNGSTVPFIDDNIQYYSKRDNKGSYISKYYGDENYQHAEINRSGSVTVTKILFPYSSWMANYPGNMPSILCSGGIYVLNGKVIMQKENTTNKLKYIPNPSAITYLTPEESEWHNEWDSRIFSKVMCDNHIGDTAHEKVYNSLDESQSFIRNYYDPEHSENGTEIIVRSKHYSSWDELWKDWQYILITGKIDIEYYYRYKEHWTTDLNNMTNDNYIRDLSFPKTDKMTQIYCSKINVSDDGSAAEFYVTQHCDHLLYNICNDTHEYLPGIGYGTNMDFWNQSNYGN